MKSLRKILADEGLTRKAGSEFFSVTFYDKRGRPVNQRPQHMLGKTLSSVWGNLTHAKQVARNWLSGSQRVEIRQVSHSMPKPGEGRLVFEDKRPESELDRFYREMEESRGRKASNFPRPSARHVRKFKRDYSCDPASPEDIQEFCADEWGAWVDQNTKGFRGQSDQASPSEIWGDIIGAMTRALRESGCRVGSSSPKEAAVRTAIMGLFRRTPRPTRLKWREDNSSETLKNGWYEKAWKSSEFLWGKPRCPWMGQCDVEADGQRFKSWFTIGFKLPAPGIKVPGWWVLEWHWHWEDGSARHYPPNKQVGKFEGRRGLQNAQKAAEKIAKDLIVREKLPRW
jgi:hypothetical protein